MRGQGCNFRKQASDGGRSRSQRDPGGEGPTYFTSGVQSRRKERLHFLPYVLSWEQTMDDRE